MRLELELGEERVLLPARRALEGRPLQLLPGGAVPAVARKAEGGIRGCR